MSCRRASEWVDGVYSYMRNECVCVYVAIYSSLQTHSKRAENFRTDFIEWFCMQIKGIIKSCLKLISTFWLRGLFSREQASKRKFLNIFVLPIHS